MSSFYHDYYSQVRGSIRFTGMSSDGFPRFEVIQGNLERLHLELSCDEEGNRPGFLFITTAPSDE